MPSVLTYAALITAIVFEVIGTSLLKQTQQFTQLAPTLAMAVSYTAAFYFLSVALKTMPVGIAYAIWSGAGIVLISAVGLVVLGQKLDVPAIIGIGLILAGVLVINIFSGTLSH